MSNTISTYISTIDSLFYQTTIEQTIRQSLLFSDEIIVVNSEHSTDGTQNLLDSLKSEYPNIINLYTFKEDFDNPNHKMRWDTVAEKKTFALRKCTKDYCILSDDDEMIHEKYANYIKLLPEICHDTIGFRFNVLHFYRSYNHHQIGDNWYKKKIYMVKNIPEIKHGLVGTDPDNHVIFDDNANKYIPLDFLRSPKVIGTPITVYHYGWANRNDCVLLMKKYEQEIQWWGRDYWKSHKFPFKFEDPEKLPKFEGTHPKNMIPIIEREKKFNTKRIKEFTK